MSATDSTPPQASTANAVASSDLVRRVMALESEIAEIRKSLELGWWSCRCCKVHRPPNWFTYRVRGHQKEPWIEPACAMCARVMFSEGPFPPPNVHGQTTAKKQP